MASSSTSRRLSGDTSRVAPLARRVRGSITPSGWGVIVLTVVAYLLGAFLHWREAFIVVGGCCIVLLISLAWLWGRLGLQLNRTIPRTQAMVGDRLVAEVTVTNPLRRPLGPRSGDDRVGEHSIPLRIPALGPKATHQVRYVVPTARRGVYPLGPLRIVRGDPFGLFRRQRTHGTRETLFIAPRVHHVDSPSSSWTQDMDGPTFDSSPRGGTTFHALREYQRGDDVRHIHWRSTARTGTLMMREYVDTRRPSTLLLLDNRHDVYTEEDFELAVEIAASVGMSSVRSGRPLAAYTAGTDLGGTEAGSIGEVLLERFCGVQLSTELTAMDDLVLGARLGGTQATETIIVTGSASEDLVPLVRGVTHSHVVIVRVQTGSDPFALVGAHVLDVATAEEFIIRWNGLVRR